jgi:UDP-glucose:(heptosyl)LPS alpha-1,3-glucosyltransferase
MKIMIAQSPIHKHQGMPRDVAWLIEGLSEHHKVVVMTNRIEDTNISRVERILRLPVIPWPDTIKHFTFFLMSSVVLGLMKITHSLPLQIIYTPNGQTMFANLMSAHFCQAERLRLVKEGRLPLPSRKGIRKTLNLYYYAAYKYFDIIERFAFTRSGVQKFIAVSEKVKQEIIQHYGISPHQVVVCYDPIDTDFFSPSVKNLFREKVRKQFNLNDQDFLLLFVGGDWARKGLPTVFEALSLIQSDDIKLFVVGHDDVGYYGKLAKMFNIDKRVIFINHKRDIRPYYGASDLIVFPTLYEPFGLVPLEGMSCELPVVVSKNAGVAEIATDGIDCLLLDNPKEAQELARKVLLLKKNSSLRADIMKAARQTALRHTRSKNVRRVEAVMQSILDMSHT